MPAGLAARAEATVSGEAGQASIEEPLRATLRMFGQLTAEGKLSAEDMREVLSADVSRQQMSRG